jgi:hypothetical protein
MMLRRLAISTTLLGCALLLCHPGVYSGEKKITKKELPGEVLSAFEKSYPKATIKGLSREEEDGKTLYEIESLDGKTARDLLYSADGKVVEIEETVAAGQLPAAVKSTVDKEHPKGKIVKAEKVTKGSIVEYEIHIAIGKKTHELVVDPAGKVIEQKKANEEKKDEDNEDVKK